MPESDKQPHKITRRTLLGGAATAAVAVVQARAAVGSFAKGLQIGTPEQAITNPDDPTRQMGAPPGKVGTRSKFETLVNSTLSDQVW